MGFHLVFCTWTPESFPAARAERLKILGNPAQYDNLQIFIEEQELLHDLIQQSTLPTFVLDISDNHISKAVDKIADWLGQTGGLYQ